MNRDRLAREGMNLELDPICIENAVDLPGWILTSDAHPTWRIHLRDSVDGGNLARFCLPLVRQSWPGQNSRDRIWPFACLAWELWWLNHWQSLEWADLDAYLDEGGVTFIDEEQAS